MPIKTRQDMFIRSVIPSDEPLVLRYKKVCSAAPTPMANITKWFTATIPTNSQEQTPACESYSTTNVIEMLARYYGADDAIPVGYQIDPTPLFAYARHKTAPNEDVNADGLPLGTSLTCAVEMGILPPSTEVIKIGMDIGELHSQLLVAPMVIGVMVSQQWATPNTENGYIKPNEGLDLGSGGHAVAFMGVRSQMHEDAYGKDIQVWYLNFQNSWVLEDGTPWGWNGYGMLSQGNFNYNALGNPFSVKITDPWISTFKEWVLNDDWRNKWLTKTWVGPQP